MPATRSGRSNTGSGPAQKASPVNGNKRKADAISPSSKDSKSDRPAKEQKTIEETLGKDVETEVKSTTAPSGDHTHTNGHDANVPATETDRTASENATEKQNTSAKQNGHAEVTKEEENESKPKQEELRDIEMKDDSTAAPAQTAQSTEKAQSAQTTANEKEQAKSARATTSGNEETSAAQESEEHSKEPSKAATESTQKHAVQEDSERKAAMPSNILEKGLIYFFTRGRVGIDDPGNVQDLQRSFFVLRPIPQGGKLTDGGVQDAGSNRLFALPKKVWPKSGRDRFMVFVEKAKVTMSTLKEEFFQGSEYSTQTLGVRHTPPVTPIGEGVYAITSTGGGQGTTHLAYMLTIPSEPGQLQNDVGIAEKGSFVLSLKNPESSGPSYASLPEKPDFPKDFIEEFRGRGWMPVAPKHLDYPNAQLLLIGEDFDSSSNLDAKPEDKQDDKKATPEEELQKLEQEDEHRVEALKGDDTIFIDLGISKKEYSGVQTTW